MALTFVEYNNEAKLKEQNGSRRADSKNGLVVTKGKGCGRTGGEGWRRGLRYTMFSTHGVGEHGENSVAQRRHIVDLWCLAALMGSDCIGVRVQLSNMVNVLTTLFFHVKPSYECISMKS